MAHTPTGIRSPHFTSVLFPSPEWPLVAPKYLNVERRAHSMMLYWTVIKDQYRKAVNTNLENYREDLCHSLNGCLSGFTGFGSTCYTQWLFLFNIVAHLLTSWSYSSNLKGCRFQMFCCCCFVFFLFAPLFKEAVLDYFANDPKPHQRENNHYCFLTFGLVNFHYVF